MRSQGCSSVVQHLSERHEVMSSIPSRKRKEKRKEMNIGINKLCLKCFPPCGWASSNQLKSLIEKDPDLPQEISQSVSRCLWTGAAASPLPWVSSLPAYPADSVRVCFCKTSLTFSLSHCGWGCTPISPLQVGDTVSCTAFHALVWTLAGGVGTVEMDCGPVAQGCVQGFIATANVSREDWTTLLGQKKSKFKV